MTLAVGGGRVRYRTWEVTELFKLLEKEQAGKESEQDRQEGDIAVSLKHVCTYVSGIQYVLYVPLTAVVVPGIISHE